MRARSPKRARQERQYLRDRAVFLDEHPNCEMRLDCCTGSATEIHHRRGRVGALLLDQSRWTGACSSCHRWVTEHPAAAYELALSEHRNHVE